MRTIDEIIIDGKTLREHLELHTKWLNNEDGGEFVILQDADLQCANLQGADLQCADLQCANLQDADLQCANLQGANLQCADLQCANLQDANLQDADLQCADLDFSVLNLSCKGLDFRIDEKQAKQLMYHVINLMQYSGLNTKNIFKKHAYKWLEDSHLVTHHKTPILEEKDE